MILSRSFPLGRTGNALFQYAFLRALSQRNNTELALPLWTGSQYFSMRWKEDRGVNVDQKIVEAGFDFNKDYLVVKGKNVDYKGYWQSEKYFADVWDDIKGDFLFKRRFLEQTLKKAEFEVKDNMVSTHVRRSDYVGNQNYTSIPVDYYTSYFAKHPHLIFCIFTDDYEFCRTNFGGFKNVVFMDWGFSDIEHLALMSQFRRHMIANSSFSWWGAKIAELYNKEVRVVRPDCLFEGRLAYKSSGKDFYPERWEKRAVFQIDIGSKVKRQELPKFTIVIPVKYDHQDRKENLNLVLSYLMKHCDPNIIVGEQGGDNFKYVEDYGVKYINFPYDDFHRTKMINQMVRAADTEIVFNWDADILIPVEQINETLLQLKNYDFVFPYDGRFCRLDRKHYNEIKERLDTNILPIDPHEPYNSKGGCVAFNKKPFIKAGMYNETFRSHAPEDVEIYHRLSCLGTLRRVKGPLFHIEHYLGPDSTHMNDWRVINKSEFRKVTSMGIEELKKYISTWSWCKI